MKREYEKPCLEVINFKLEERIMDVDIGGDPTIDESVPDDW